MRNHAINRSVHGQGMERRKWSGFLLRGGYTKTKIESAKIINEYMEESTLKIKKGYIRSQIKAQIMLAGYTMAEAVELLSTEYGWSDSLSNFSAKLRRESLRYKDVLELADVLGYEIVWQKGRDRE